MSKQIPIVTTSLDAKLLLDLCLERGGWFYSVLPPEFWQAGLHEPKRILEEGYSAQVLVRFDDGAIRKAGAFGRLELDFEGMVSNSKVSAIDVGRLFAHEVALTHPEITEAWSFASNYVKRTFRRHVPAATGVRKRAVWIGPNADLWLKEADRILICSEQDYVDFNLPRLG